MREVKHIFDQLFDAVYYVEPGRKITYWNPTAEELTGFSAAETVGRYCYDNILNHVDEEGRQLCKDGCPLEQTLRDGRKRKADVYLLHKDGHRVPVSVRVSPVRDEAGTIIGALELFRDNSSVKAMKQEIDALKRQSYEDVLTGLPNRRKLQIDLERCCHELKRYNWSAGVILLDMDHFKTINDRFGHSVGDLVLKVAGATLQHSCRTSDQFGRWGGEEFVGILRNVNQKTLRLIAERSRVLLSRSRVRAGEQAIEFTASIGATLLQPGDTPESAIERADEFLYRSKAEGRNRVTCGT